MKKKLFGWVVSVSMLFMVLAACEKDKESPDELSDDIQNIVADSTLENIIAMGMVINKGIDPPDIENSYLASPYELKATNVSGDWSIGTVFSDYYFRFYDQDKDALTVKVDYSNGGETGSGLGGFLSGDGKKFSVFVELNAEYNDYPAKLVHIISGTITEDGIEDFFFTNYMLDNNGNEGGYWIENGEGRVFIDSDNISPVTSFPEAKKKSTNPTASTGATRK